jgi:hypothetical protein
MGFRGLSAIAAVCAALLVAAGPAAADTAFGGDPGRAVSGITCNGIASCMWETTNTTVPANSDYVPFSASGGSGTITSVTLPAMPNPGPMQAVVLTASVTTTTDPGHPDFACCQVKDISPTFTVPANTVSTVPLNMHVTDSDVNGPVVGDTAFADVMAISVLAPDKTIPIVGNNEPTTNTVSYPAPSAPTGEYRAFQGTYGYQLLARFTLSTGDPVGGGTNGTVVSPAGGLKLGKTIGVPAGARRVSLGTATNPPTAATRQRLTATPRALGAAASAKKKKKARRKTIGTGKTTVKAGKTSSIRISLSRTARSRLARGHKVKCTLTVVATGTTGAHTTVTRAVTLKPKKRKKKR